VKTLSTASRLSDWGSAALRACLCESDIWQYLFDFQRSNGRPACREPWSGNQSKAGFELRWLPFAESPINQIERVGNC
jgi:hypothetical protein